MATVLLQNKESIKFSDVSQLTCSDFMRDAKLMCRDGTLWWSAVLICQWSRIARSKMSELGVVTPDFPLAIVLPDTALATMQKFLTWTLRGDIIASPEDAAEMKEIISSLAVDVGMSQSPVKEEGLDADDDDANSEASENADVAEMRALSSLSEGAFDEDKSVRTLDGRRISRKRKNFKDDSPDQISKGKRSKQTTDDPLEMGEVSDSVPPETTKTEAPTTSAKGSKNKFQCPLCEVSCPKGSALVYHLCYVHYRKELLQIWGKDASENPPCFICNKRLFEEGDAAKVAIRQRKICNHLGKAHRFVLCVAEENVRRALVDTRLFPKTEENESLTFPDCDVCLRVSSESRTFKLHLAQAHYSEQLLTNFSFVGSKAICRICKMNITGESGGRIYAMVHILAEHEDDFDETLRKSCTNSEAWTRFLEGKPPETNSKDAGDYKKSGLYVIKKVGSKTFLEKMQVVQEGTKDRSSDVAKEIEPRRIEIPRDPLSHDNDLSTDDQSGVDLSDIKIENLDVIFENNI